MYRVGMDRLLWRLWLETLAEADESEGKTKQSESEPEINDVHDE